MPSLATLSLVLCLAACHVTSQMWFPDSNNNNAVTRGNHRRGPVPVEDLRQRSDASIMRTGRHGLPSQQPNGPWKSQPDSRNALRRTVERPSSQWSPQRNDGGQWNRSPVLVKRIAAVKRRPNVASRVSDEDKVPAEEQDFEDYWMEDDLKDQQEMEAAAVATTTTVASVAANEIDGAGGKPTAGPSRCVWAIVSCCRPTAKVTSQVRYSCFEAVGCHGAFWDVNPCSQQMMAAALAATANFYKVPAKGDD